MGATVARRRSKHRRWVCLALLATWAGGCGTLLEGRSGGPAKGAPFLFPQPQEARFGKEQWSLSRESSWRIATALKPHPLVEKAAQRLERFLGRLGVRTTRGTRGVGPLVMLGVRGELPLLDKALKKARVATPKEEQGYSLVTQKGPKILIGGRDGLGVLYGVTTLEQLVRPQRDPRELSVAKCRIRDWPDIKHRAWGELADFRRWNTDAAHNDAFEKSFEQYVQDSLVRRRINWISTRYGGFKRHERAGQNPVIRDRLRRAVRIAREYGIEVEYADITTVAGDEGLKSTPPYDELIWHARPWGGGFICYSRDDLIRAAAERLADFLTETGIRAVYMHQFDGPGGGWRERCSECRKAYPDDADREGASLGAAQAHLGNVYYSTLKDRISDLQFVMVPSIYQGVRGRPIYHDALHRDLSKDVIPVLRENLRNDVVAFRSRYPKRPLYVYVEPDESTEYDILFSWVARFTKDYFFHNPDDVLFVWTREAADPHIDSSSHAFYAWNVDALGAESCAGRVLDPQREAFKRSADAEEALRRIVDYEYGAPWGELFSEVVSTWLGSGVVQDPKWLDPRGRRRRENWRWKRVREWFDDALRGKSDGDAWLEFHRLQVAEAKRLEPKYDTVFARADVPKPMWRLYAMGKGTCILAEPRLRELECRQQKGRPSEVSLQAARAAVDRAASAQMEAEARIKGLEGKLGWRSLGVGKVLKGIREYLATFDPPVSEGEAGADPGKSKRANEP